MAEGGKRYELSSALIWKLSRRITDGTKLLDLGTFVLKLPDYETEGAEYNKKTIQEAALHILDKWRTAQNNRQEAFDNLHVALWSTKYFRTLASELLEWAEEEQKNSGPPAKMPRISGSSAELQREVKEAQIDRFKNFLKNDWLDDAKTMPLVSHYTEPDWIQTIKGGLEDKMAPLPGGLYQILERSEGRIRVLVTGKPGSGKTSALAKLALDWAQDSSAPKPETGLHKFSFMFVVTLRDVDSNDSLEDIIIQQYEEYGLNDEHKDQIKAILKAPTTLIAFDGYDEFKKKVCSDIDAIISGKRQMSYIVTSRPGDYLEKKDQQKMTKVQIAGLSQQNIQQCAKKYLDSDDDQSNSARLISESHKVGIDDLLATPIVLLLVCVLFKEKHGSLPQTKTEIVQEIVNMLIDRSTAKGKLPKMEPEEIQKILKVLGQLSWQASQKDTKQLYLDKTQVEQANAYILNFGLLHGSMMPEKSTRHKQPEWLTYPHKLIQDFLAGLFAAKCTKVEVQGMFPSWEDIKKQSEVVKFMCGLRDDPSDVIDHISQQFVEDHLGLVRSKGFSPLFVNPLIEFAQETKGKSVNPLCNDHIYYVQELPLIRKSKVYLFNNIKGIGDGTAEPDTGTCTSQTCSIYVYPHKNQPDRAVEILAAISRLDQKLTHLYISKLMVPEFTGPVFKLDAEARSVVVEECELPPSVQQDLGQQLASCQEVELIHLIEMPHIAAEVIENLGAKTNLTHLRLAYCNLSEEVCLVLCQQLRLTHHLRELHLSENDIGSAGASALAEAITSWGPNCALEDLGLSDCDIDAEMMKALRSCTELKKLDISDNPLGSAGARLLAEAITSWGPKPPLQELYMNGCNIDSEGCVALMEALPSCSELFELNLSHNSIGGTFRDLDHALISPQLGSLNVSSTSLLEADIRNIDLMTSNQKMPQLEILSLGYQKLRETEDKIRQEKRDLNSEGVLRVMLESESDEMLPVWRSILQNVERVRLEEGSVEIEDTRKVVEAEEKRRRGDLDDDDSDDDNRDNDDE